MLLDSVAYYHLAIACTPLPHTAIMSSDYEISDDENEYYDEEDDEMEVDFDDGAHTLVYTRPGLTDNAYSCSWPALQSQPRILR